MSDMRLMKRNDTRLKMRSNESISSEELLNIFGKYLFFSLEGSIGFGYCSSVCIYSERHNSSVTIEIPHMQTWIEKSLNQFDWFKPIKLSEMVDETGDKNQDSLI